MTRAATSISASVREVQAGHLAVDPDESFVHEEPPYSNRDEVRPSSDSVEDLHLGCGLVSDRTPSARGWLDAWAARPATPWIGLVIRLVLGGFILWASLSKITDPYASVASVRAYDLLPEPLVKLLGYSLPLVELLVGVCLILGSASPVSPRSSPPASWSCSSSASPSVWARGMEIDCGCFGDGGPKPGASKMYPWEIARDVGFFLMAAWLIAWPRTKYALDDLLFRQHPRKDPRCRTSPLSSRAARTAALMKEQQRKERMRQLTIVGAIMALLAVVVLVGFFVMRSADDTSKSTVSRQRVRAGHRSGGRADRGGHLRGLPVPGVRLLREHHLARSWRRPRRPARCASSTGRSTSCRP